MVVVVEHATKTTDSVDPIAASEWDAAHTVTGAVEGVGGITTIEKVTQAEYDALTPPDANTLYVIVG